MTEGIGERPKTMVIQNETMVFYLPEVFALALVEDER